MALCIVPAASAKFDITLSLSQHHPRVRETVRVVARSDEPAEPGCRMRLLAVAPGISKFTALDAFIGGGYGVIGPQGPAFHPLPPTRRMGFLLPMTRVGHKTWRSVVRFPSSGRWTLIVPNWCAPGYTYPSPADRVVTVG